MVNRDAKSVVDIGDDHIECPLVMVVNGKAAHDVVPNRHMPQRTIGRVTEQAQASRDRTANLHQALRRHVLGHCTQRVAGGQRQTLTGAVHKYRQSPSWLDRGTQSPKCRLGILEVVKHPEAVREVKGRISKRRIVDTPLNDVVRASRPRFLWAAETVSGPVSRHTTSAP